MANIDEELGDAIESGAESAGELAGFLDDAVSSVKGLVNGLEDVTGVLDKVGTAFGFLGTGFAALAKDMDLSKAFSFMFAKTLIEINDLTTDLVSSFGQTSYFSDAIQSTLIDANVELFELGVTIEEISETIEGFNSELGRMNLLTSEEVTRMNVLAKATDLSSSEIAQMVASMSDLGMGTTTAIEKIESMTVEAQRLGLNVNTYINSISQNVKLLNQYGFDKGINGLSRMVAKAQALRFDIQQAVNIADGILDGGPERAVELAAELATLGGDIGELGDPYALMFNSLNDVGAIQDSLVDLASAAASVNEETGQLEIPTYARERLRQQAKLLGVPFEQLTAAAINSKKQIMALEEIEFSGLAGMSDEDKQFIANISEINEKGEMVVKLKEEDGTTREIQLSDEDGIAKAMTELKEQQAAAEMDPKDALMENTKAMVSLKEAMDTLSSKEAFMRLGAGAFDSKPVTDMIRDLKLSVGDLRETMSDTAKNIGDIFEDKEVTAEEVKGLVDTTAGLLKEDVTKFAERMGLSSVALDTFITALDNAVKTIKDIDLSEEKIDIKNLTGESREVSLPTGEAIEGGLPVEDAIEVQDFIMRPGQDIVKFDKDDIVIGGTDPFGVKSQSKYEPVNNLPSIFEKQSSALDSLYNNVSTSVQKIEQTMAVKDINVNVSGTISVTDRNGNMVDLLRNSDVQNQIVMIVEDAFKRGKDQFA
jgi:hypothetical protein